MFRNREDAGRQLAQKLKGRALRQAIVLGIPRGGVVIGAALAGGLDADLDVVLSRKLRAPNQPELALGAISETGDMFLNHHAEIHAEEVHAYLADERHLQLAEIARSKRLFRTARPPAPISGRSVIVTDDGIATGSTMLAALRVAKAQAPHELIVAVPVASPERLPALRRWCDEIICLASPTHFWAIGQFYEDFSQVEDEEVLNLLREVATRPKTERPGR